MPIREPDSMHPAAVDQPALSGETAGALDAILHDICQMIESNGRGLACSISVSPDAGTQAEGALTQELVSSEGDLLGRIALSYPEGQSEAPGDRELLRSASHLASTAIEQRMPVRRDALTGLLTRSYFSTQAASSSACAVLSIDFDRFQPINDSFGREMGDRLLRQVSERLKGLLGEADFAGRLDGVEFAIALMSEPDEPSALRKAGEFLEALRAPYRIDGVELFLTASIGVAVNGDGCDAEQLLREATQAMHVAKRSGGNGLEVFRPENHARSVERLRLENALHRAIENQELAVRFQPIFDTHQNLEGFEALLAWHHPVFGGVPPGVFIPIAEENGFIAELGAWVMRQACLQGARWRQAGLPGIRLSVNVSAREFENAEYGKILAETLAATGFPPEFLELELTESSIVRDLPRSAERMAALRELGLSIAIDDFGTGYSSLSYLSKLPVDTLKLDQSFIRDIAENASLPVIHGIVRLAHSMHLVVVAEGVETHGQLELIRLMGCDRTQGSLWGPSLGAHEAEELLARRNSSNCAN